MTLSLVIFDCDGVLVETEARMNDGLAAYFTERGLVSSLFHRAWSCHVGTRVPRAISRPFPA